MNIRKDATKAAPVVTLISKNTSVGMVKKGGSTEAFADNYLTLYLYSHRRLVDSIKTDHPLYKHLEYVDENKRLSAKDTALDNADFFVRIQTEGVITVIRIVETCRNKKARELSSIQL